MKQQTLSVPDISCGHCKSAIEQAVRGVAGVSEVVVNVDAKTVALSFDREETLSAIVAAIESQGYEISS